MEANIEHEGIKNYSIFSGLTIPEIEKLKPYLILEEYKPGAVIFSEGNESSEMYFILEGEVEVLKWDDEHCSVQLIGKLEKGETFGEIAFLETSKRSTTIKTIVDTKVYKLTRDSVSAPEMDVIRGRIYQNIAMINNRRLRSLNMLYVKNLKQMKADSKKEQTEGAFTLLEYLMLFLLSFICWKLWPLYGFHFLWLLAVIPTYLILKSFKFTLDEVGLDFHTWKNDLKNALLIVVGIVVTYFIIGLLAHRFVNLELKPITFAPAIPFQSPWLNVLFLAVYAFAHEWIARGVLQSKLSGLFRDKSGYKALFINALFLFTLAIPFGLKVAGIIFFISLPLGYFFLVQKNILGVFVIHFMLLFFGLLYL